MSKGRRKNVMQLRWTAIVEVIRAAPFFGEPERLLTSYDIMEWNLYKLRWGRMAKATNFGTLENAAICAQKRDEEINRMIESNKTIPPRLSV